MSASEQVAGGGSTSPGFYYGALRPLLSATYHKVKVFGVRPVLGAPGRLLYGNAAGFLNNYRANKLLASLRAQSDIGPQPDDVSAAAAELRDNGYLPLASEFDPALVQTIHDRVHELMEDPEHSIPRAHGNYSRCILSVSKRIPQMTELLTDRLKGIIEAYYGTHFYVEHITCWRNKHVPAHAGDTEVFSNLWHCDEYLPTRLKLFVNLTDTTRETGAFRLHPRPVTRQVVRGGYKSREWVTGKARAILDDPEQAIYAEGPKGSAVFCNTQQCLHAASVPAIEGSYRDIVEFKLSPCAEPLPDDWAENVPPDPFEDAVLSGAIRFRP